MRQLRKPKRKMKMERTNQTRLGSATMGLTSQRSPSTVQKSPEVVSCIGSMINRAQEHNEALRRLVDRTRDIGDRMFGGMPQDGKNGAEAGGPSNALGMLETQLIIGEQIACTLLSEIQRLEVL